MLDDLLAAWQTNNRINLFLLDQISDEGLLSTLSTRGARDVARQFAHMHNIRIYQLENRRAKDLAEGLSKFPTKVSPARSQLKDAFVASGAAVDSFLGDVLTGESNRRSFKRGVFTTLSYFVAHESHHRGNILLTLKQSGHTLDKAAQYGIWAWDNI